MDIGSMELVLILIIALIVFGPQRLAEIGRLLGKTVQDFRKLRTELTKSITQEDAKQEGNVGKTIQEIRKIGTELKKPIKEMDAELTKAIDQEDTKKGDNERRSGK